MGSPCGAVLVDDADKVMRRLGELKVGTRPFFWPMHAQPVFAHLAFAGPLLVFLKT